MSTAGIILHDVTLFIWDLSKKPINNNDSMSLYRIRVDKQEITKVRSNDFAVVQVFQSDLFRQTSSALYGLYGIIPNLYRNNIQTAVTNIRK